ncbi:hypothetical protein [Micropruina sonneratiae]|uniref:hypothetical protein n=1 Tax=Micropruina sonneratiae TaxID=2986940 RepID=UPI0022268556|nr:hypothetical protein [Micropruina sp. KQZ13P-5]MCW3159610.1 hypothetical protein [Micropruina sp. KQZ13P-5]
MNLSTWVMIAVIGWTVVGLVLVAGIWSRAPWKAVLAWLGIALLPLGVWLAGLSQAAIDGWNTLAMWWQGLVFTVPVLIGLSVLGLAVALLVLSRLVPNRKRTRKPVSTAAPASVAPAREAPVYRQPPRNEAEQTLILPENRQNTP